MTMTTAGPIDGRHLQSPRSARWALAIRLRGEKEEA